MMTITLGELCRQLRNTRNQEAEVVFDFIGLTPGQFRSSRGNYEDLAIGVGERGATVTVAMLLKAADAEIGSKYHGYKGGEFDMDERTRVWVDNWGDWTSTAIIGLRDEDWRVVIETRYGEI